MTTPPTRLPSETPNDRLRIARVARGLTQKQLAAKAGRDETSVSRHETGTLPMGPKAVQDYALVLGVSEPWLQYGIGPAPDTNIAEIVAEYLSSDLGRSCPEDIARRLWLVPYDTLGVPYPTVEVVHRVRELIAINLLLEGQKPNESVRQPAP